MLEVNFPLSNIFREQEKTKLDKKYEKLKLSRMELEKKILRRTTDSGTDVGLRLNSGVKLQNGDIIESGDKLIIIEQLPEKIISIKLVKNKKPEVLVLLGHIIGNRHRPISITENEIKFPIQADSEKEVFSKLLANILDNLEITIKEELFSPHEGANVHEH